MFLQTLLSIIAIVISGFLGYWAQDREDPITIISIEAVEPVVAGGILKVRYEIERERYCHVRLEQVLFDADGVRHTVPDEDYYTSPGQIGQDKFSVQIHIPKTTAKGEAIYRGVRTYYCNPLHTWLDWPIVVFTPPVKVTIL